jgi:cytidine deaminase
MSPTGAIIAVGANDVPKAGGGLYWPTDDPDRRDLKRDEDPADSAKMRLVANLLSRMKDAGWLAEDKKALGTDADLAAAAMADAGLRIKESELTGITEFGRTVHAEMACLSDAAARGVPVSGCTLFTTTFPCHPCGRHLIAAGIQRVVFVEPYPKSRLLEFHGDEVALDEGKSRDDDRRVRFVPFIGLAPRRYMALFTMVDRKDETGKVIKWDPDSALLRIPVESTLASPGKEAAAIASFNKRLEDMETGGGTS